MENCIGECFVKGEKALHPITLEVLINNGKEKLCPSQPYVEDFNNEKEIVNAVVCTKKKTPAYQEIEDFMITPEIKFNPDTFLNLYNIYNFYSAIIWAKNNLEQNTPILSILRNLNLSWKLYYKNIKKISDETIDIYILIFDKINKDFLKLKFDSKKKYMTKSLKKFLINTNSWNDIDFNSLLIIKKYLKKYVKK